MEANNRLGIMVAFLVIVLYITGCSSYPRGGSARGTQTQTGGPLGDIIQIPCKPCTCFYSPHYKIIANCDDKNLTKIPSTLPHAISELSMRNNELENLKRGMFEKFPDLEKVSLAFNRISSMEEGSFEGLTELLELDLQGNHLDLSGDVYRPHVFAGLEHLKTLRLNNNSDTDQGSHALPGVALANLSSLERLDIDGFPNMTFDSNFLRLRKLNHLNISGHVGNCHLNGLSNDTFVNVPYVRILNLTHCYLRQIEAAAFQPLKQLQALDLSENSDLGFDEFGKAAFGLQYLPTEILKVNNIYGRYATCVKLQIRHLQYLRNTVLREIDMDGDRLEIFEKGALTQLPETLTTVSAKFNRLTFGMYLQDLPLLKNLRYIDLSDEGVNYKIPSLPFENEHVCSWPHGGRCDVNVEANLSPFAGMYEGSKIHRKIIFPVPPNLTSIAFKWKKMYYHLDEFGLTENNLQDLDLSRNIFSEWHGPLWGMDKVVKLDLSSNFAHYISIDFFKNFTSLKVLNVTNNFFYKTLADGVCGKIFSRLPALEILDVSRNHLTHVHENLMQGLHSLKTFLCTSNKIQADYLNLSIDYAPNITWLDFSENSLETFPIRLRRGLDSVVARNRTVHLDISYNPFACDCENLDFLYWLRKTKVTLLRIDKYYCRLKNGTYSSMRNLDQTIADVEQTCTQKVVLFFGASMGIILMFLIMAALIVYRFRWKLYYLYYVARNKTGAVEAGGEDEEERFQYDAFISFAIDDRQFIDEELRVKLEEENGIKLCLEYRDIHPAKNVAESIVECVQNSRRTVCILTPAYLEDKENQFEFEMARMESIYKKRDVVLFVLKDHVISRSLPRHILYYIKTESYVEYPRDERCVDFFWDNLIKALKSPEDRSGSQSRT